MVGEPHETLGGNECEHSGEEAVSILEWRVDLNRCLGVWDEVVEFRFIRFCTPMVVEQIAS